MNQATIRLRDLSLFRIPSTYKWNLIPQAYTLRPKAPQSAPKLYQSLTLFRREAPPANRAGKWSMDKEIARDGLLPNAHRELLQLAAR